MSRSMSRIQVITSYSYSYFLLILIPRRVPPEFSFRCCFGVNRRLSRPPVQAISGSGGLDAAGRGMIGWTDEGGAGSGGTAEVE